MEGPAPTLKRFQGLCLDKNYDRNEVYELLEAFGFTPHIRRRGEEAHAITGMRKFKPRRWVVERTHSWMNRFRGILPRWTKKDTNYKDMLYLVMGLITWPASITTSA